jgi:4-hydroxy-tetrahydrodipicolinate reductase
MSLKIAIAGAAGRMGQALIKAAAQGDFDLGGGAVISDAVNRAAASADVWLDFTTPEATLSALDQLKSTKVRAAIVGTTGLAQQHDQKIAEHAKRIAIVKTGNFSLGVNLLLGLIEQAAARLGEGWDVEISETHHNRKVDAPSGTALMMGETAAKSRGGNLVDLRVPPYDGLTGPRKEGSIGFAVTRGGGVIGDHEIRFISGEEIVSIGHRALDRALFAKGALHAARWAAGQKPGLYSMRDVLGL